MTEQELNQNLERIEKNLGRRTAGCLMMCLLLAGFICGIALAASSSLWFFLLFLAIPFYWSCELIVRWIMRRQTPNSLQLWDEWMLFYSSEEGTSQAARKFAGRIRSLYLSQKTEQILPFHLAARLLDTFHKQQTRLQQIESKLRRVENIYRPLEDGVARLEALKTPHESGRRSLRELEEEHIQLLQLKAHVASSSRKLEAILERAEFEAQKRDLHDEVTRLSRAVTTISSEELPEFALQGVASDFETQITAEVTHYMRMEQEVEKQLS